MTTLHRQNWGQKKYRNQPVLLAIAGTVLFLTLPCFGQSTMERRLVCLSAVESGNCDTRIGPSGEVSRYQITPAVWSRATKLPLLEAGNAFTAKNVATGVQERRIAGFRRTHHRDLIDYEFYLLWSRPATLLTRNRPVTAKEAQRAQFYSNLCQKPLATANNLSQQ